MIKYNLKCENDHEFESWFSNSNEFDKLKKKKLLECIFCSSKKIEKSIMAPMISGAKLKEEDEALFDNKSLKQRNNLLKLREHVEKNFEFVGDKFSEKVRDVYYDKETMEPVEDNRYEPQYDDSIVDLDDTRQTRLTLRQINRARKASELHTKEKAKDNDLVRAMYGIAAQQQAAGV
mgnify:CR=1 FL=1